MKTLRLGMFLVFVWVGVVFAQSWKVQGFAFENVTSAYNTVATLTAATYTPTGNVPPVKRAIITLEDAHVRWRADGTNPAVSTGHLLKIDDVVVLESIEEISNFAIIGLSPTSASIMVTFER